MIPNTDINCQKCATPMYSDCVMWSGGDLTCLTLTKDCCDVSLTSVINTLGGYVCNFSYISGYTIPVCMDSYNISDFKGMQQAMLNQFCVLQSEIGDLTFDWGCYSSGTTVISSATAAIQHLIDETCTNTSLALDWKCFTSGSTNSINNSFQAIINATNQQKISYASSQFVVSGSSATCDQVLYLKQGEWVPFLPYKYGGTSTTPITKLDYNGNYSTVEVSNGFSLANSAANPSSSYSQPQMFAYLDSLGYVTIIGTFIIGVQTSSGVYSTGSGITSAYLSSGTPGFTNENGSSSIQMSSSGTYMKLFTMPTISGVNYTPGSRGITGTPVRAEISTCGYGVNYDNQYYSGSSGNPSGGTSYSANYSACLNYPTAYFPVYLTYNKDTTNANRLNVVVQPCWNSSSKIPITLYVKFTFNINN